MKPRVCIAILLGLLMLGLVGMVEGGDDKRLMMVFTTDTNAELEPCG